jgi:hypothetical protein
MMGDARRFSFKEFRRALEDRKNFHVKKPLKIYILKNS